MQGLALPHWLTVTVDGRVTGPDGPLGSDDEAYGRLAGWPLGLVPRAESWHQGDPLDVPVPLVPWVVARLEHHGGRLVSAASELLRSPGAA